MSKRGTAAGAAASIVASAALVGAAYTPIGAFYYAASHTPPQAEASMSFSEAAVGFWTMVVQDVTGQNKQHSTSNEGDEDNPSP